MAIGSRVAALGWRVAAAATVAFDVAFRALATLWNRLPEEVVTALVSLGVNSAATASAIAVALSWLLVAYVLYRASRWLVPVTVRDADRWPGYRVVFVASALAVAVTAPAAFESVNRTPPVGVAVVLSAAVLVTYLRWSLGWDLLALDGEAVALVDAYAPHADIRDDLDGWLTATGWKHRVSAVVWLTALGAVLVLPCVAAGFAAVYLANAFPLPEVLVLAGVALPDERRTPFDLEHRVYATITEARRSQKGTMLVVLGFVGVSGAGFTLSMATSLASPLLDTAVIAAGVVPVYAWDVAGFFVLLVAAALHWTWCWLRLLDRLPPFLDQWEGGEARRVAARPVGLTAPGTAALLAATWFAGRMDDVHGSAVETFAVAWPGVFVAVAACVAVTFRRPETLAGAEDRAVAVALIVEGAGVVAAGNASAPSLTAAILDPRLLLVGLAVPALVYLPAVIRWADHRSGARRHVDVVFLLGFGVATAGLATMLSTDVTRLLWALTAVAVVGAGAIIGVRYVESD